MSLVIAWSIRCIPTWSRTSFRMRNLQKRSHQRFQKQRTFDQWQQVQRKASMPRYHHYLSSPKLVEKLHLVSLTMNRSKNHSKINLTRSTRSSVIKLWSSFERKLIKRSRISKINFGNPSAKTGDTYSKQGARTRSRRWFRPSRTSRVSERKSAPPCPSWDRFSK